MKNIINYIVCSMLILGIAVCGDMYDDNEKYLKMGEETYLGIASDLEGTSGFNRIELKWKTKC